MTSILSKAGAPSGGVSDPKTSPNGQIDDCERRLRALGDPRICDPKFLRKVCALVRRARERQEAKPRARILLREIKQYKRAMTAAENARAKIAREQELCVKATQTNDPAWERLVVAGFAAVFGPTLSALEELSCALDDRARTVAGRIDPRLRNCNKTSHRESLLDEPYDLTRFGTTPAQNRFVLELDAFLIRYFASRAGSLGRMALDTLISDIFQKAFAQHISPEAVKQARYRARNRQPNRRNLT